MRRNKKYEELTIADDFMFGKIMRDPKRCKTMLEIILGIRIRKLVFLDDQKALNPDYRARGIRLDIYAEDEANTIYNVEMQLWRIKNLPKRSRYYQSIIDINMVEKGAAFDELNKSYVIFICDFDPFGMGRHIYHFENLCLEDPAVRLNDGAVKIFLNIRGTADDVNEDLKNLLDYFKGCAPRDAYTRSLEQAVADAKLHKEWRRDYMRKLQMLLYDERMEGEAAGLRKGRAEGRSAGTQLTLIRLICRKIAKGKSLDQIAEDLDEDIDQIQPIYDACQKHAPAYDQEAILKDLMRSPGRKKQ